MIQQSENAKGPDYGVVAGLKFLIVFIPGVPAILVTNSLLMVPRWRAARVVCGVGFILPALLVFLEFCLLTFWR